MNCRPVAKSSTTSLFPAIREAVSGGGAAACIQAAARRERRRWPGVFCSSSAFRPRAAAASFYELLGIPEDGSSDEVKQAYKRMARKYHPDVSPPEHAEEHTRHFIALQEAYQTLSDPAARAIYDRNLRLAFSGMGISELEEKSRWKNHWGDQLAGLKGRSMNKDSENLSWAARMRKRRAESQLCCTWSLNIDLSAEDQLAVPES